eukprot:1521482-Rhodomonas_salina.2
MGYVNTPQRHRSDDTGFQYQTTSSRVILGAEHRLGPPGGQMPCQYRTLPCRVIGGTGLRRGHGVRIIIGSVSPPDSSIAYVSTGHRKAKV